MQQEDRFHIIVFNYNHIELFTSNFHTLRHFDKRVDKIFVFDCSEDFYAQQRIILTFCISQRLQFGRHIFHVKRTMWGRDQGAKIDYLLRYNQYKAKYVWLMQEHYLDNTSAYSRWPSGKTDIQGRNVDGQLKNDVLPQGATIDLDTCEKVFETNSSVGMLYANIGGIGYCRTVDGSEWMNADGPNYCLRNSVMQMCFPKKLLSVYKRLYDCTYQWALFIELDSCRRLSNSGSAWYDVVAKICFAQFNELICIEKKRRKTYHHVLEKKFFRFYELYKRKRMKLEEGNLLYQGWLAVSNTVSCMRNK